jgi:hypothetical protein
LELEQQVEIEPAVFIPAKPQAPDEVAVALAQVIGDEAVADPLQGGEIEPVEPILTKKICLLPCKVPPESCPWGR